jgi:hypothetical protein
VHLAKFESQLKRFAETAPLLRDDAEDDEFRGEDAQPTLAERINAIAQEPLTPLTQVLLVVALALLLLSSVCVLADVYLYILLNSIYRSLLVSLLGNTAN